MNGAATRLPGFARPALMLAGLVAAGFALRLLPSGGAAGLLAGGGGAAHAASLLALGAVLVAVGVPRQIVCYAAGLAFGAVTGAALALVAQLLGCVADFAWARLLGRGFVSARLRGRLARLDHAVGARPFATILSLRLLPVGNNLVLNLAAGVSSIAAAPFLAASAIGYLPQTAVFALAGSGVRVGQGAQLGMAVALFAVSAALGAWLWRRESARARSDHATGANVSAAAGSRAPRPG